MLFRLPLEYRRAVCLGAFCGGLSLASTLDDWGRGILGALPFIGGRIDLCTFELFELLLFGGRSCFPIVRYELSRGCCATGRGSCAAGAGCC